jgi:MFS family permease
MRERIRRQLRLLGNLINRPYPIAGTSDTQRRGMHLIWWDTIWTAISGAFYGDFLVLYLLAIGASSASIGTRSAINSAASLLAPLLGAWLVQRTGQRKKWVLWGGGGVAHMSLFLAVLVPFLFPGVGAVAATVALLALQAFGANLAMPPWRSLFGDIVPLPIRGRYMGLRMMATNVIAVGIVPLAGWLIRKIGGIEGYQLALFIATVAGVVGVLCYARIPEPERGQSPGEEREDSGGGFVDGLKLFVRDRTFVYFCLINWIWNLGTQISGPFFSVHMVETLGFRVDTISLIATVSTVFNILAVRVAGPLVDRKGAARVTAVSMLLVPLMPVGWILARTPFHVILVRAYGFVAWAGFHVAATPLLLHITPARYRSQFIAYYTTINSIAAIIGPIIASSIYDQFGFTTNLALSAAGRGLGALLFLLLFLRGGLRENDTTTQRILA